jgi:predicted RNA-binding Zn ribbon-like protein
MERCEAHFSIRLVTQKARRGKKKTKQKAPDRLNAFYRHKSSAAASLSNKFPAADAFSAADFSAAFPSLLTRPLFYSQ